MAPVAKRVADKRLLGLIRGVLITGEQVKAIVIDFLARRLQLRANTDKNTMDRPAGRTFPDFGFTVRQTP